MWKLIMMKMVLLILIIVTVMIIMIILESYTVTSIYSFFQPARKLYIPILNSLQNKKRVSLTNLLHWIFQKFEYVSLKKNRKFTTLEQLCGTNEEPMQNQCRTFSFTIEMKKKSFEVSKKFL